jgi:ABC-type branched-subunit amino acid transport system substrate-binding protein
MACRSSIDTTALVKLCFVGIALAVPAGCSGRSPTPIWVGHVAALSGPQAEAGQSAARGIRLAVEEIDKDLSQGVGRPFKVIHADTRGKLEAFESEAVRLSALNHVAFLLGGTSADEVERLERGRVQPVLSPLGSSVRMLGDRVYFTGISVEQRANALARFAVHDLGVRSVALLEDERTEEAAAFAGQFEKDFRAAWAKVEPGAGATVRRLLVGKTGKTDEWEAFARAQPPGSQAVDVLVFAGKSDDLASLDPLPRKLLLAWGDGSDFARRLGDSKECTVYRVTPFHVDQAPAFVARYCQAFPDKKGVQGVPDEHAAVAYEGMKLIYEAVVQCKDDLKLEPIIEQLRQLKDQKGVAGLLSFNPRRQLRRSVCVVEVAPNAGRLARSFGPEE